MGAVLGAVPGVVRHHGTEGLLSVTIALAIGIRAANCLIVGHGSMLKSPHCSDPHTAYATLQTYSPHSA